MKHFFQNLSPYVIDKWFIKNPKLRRWVTRLIYGECDTEVHVLGTTLVVNSLRENGYLRAAKSAATCSLWRDETSSLLSLFAVLRAGDTFVDIGANIGVFSCSVSRLPGIKVRAFEANPDTFKRLSANAKRHGVQADQIAISDQAGEMEFVDGAVSHVFAAATHRNAYHTGSSQMISTMRLDDLLTTERPLIFKIDVEGHEPAVLRGAQELIKCGAVQAVLLDASHESKQAADFLKTQGFEILDAATLLPETNSTGVFLALAPDRSKLLRLLEPS